MRKRAAWSLVLMVMVTSWKSAPASSLKTGVKQPIMDRLGSFFFIRSPRHTGIIRNIKQTSTMPGDALICTFTPANFYDGYCMTIKSLTINVPLFLKIYPHKFLVIICRSDGAVVRASDK